MTCFISLQTSQENLDKLVENYTNGKVLPNSGIIDITYGNYNQLLCILTSRGFNVQQAMTTLLPQIHTDAVSPNNIAILTQNVKKHFQLERKRMKL